MAKITTIKKAAKKKKMSKQDEKQIKDYEEREKAEKGYDDDAIRYGMKESALQMDESDSGLAAKARKSGVSLGILQKVYRRGVAAWNSGHRPGTTPQQWGMARVNSYITKGKGTYHGADKDLREEELLEVAKDKESGLPKKYVSGLSASTAKARAAHWKEKSKLSDRDPAAYEPAPGDANAKTKESKHTIKAREMFEQSVYDARPKQKTDVDVSGRTDGKKNNYVYSMRDRRLGDSNPAHREFARIRIGDTELAKKEKEVADRLKQKLKEENDDDLYTNKSPKEKNGDLLTKADGVFPGRHHVYWKGKKLNVRISNNEAGVRGGRGRGSNRGGGDHSIEWIKDNNVVHTKHVGTMIRAKDYITDMMRKKESTQMNSESFQINESKIGDKIKSHPGVEYYGGKDDDHMIYLKRGYWHPGLQQTSFGNETSREAARELKDVRKMTPAEVDNHYSDWEESEREKVKAALKEEKEDKITSKIVKGIVHINGKPLNHSSVEVDGVNKKDYPDFADAYTSRAEFKDGSELSHEELEHLDMNHPEVAHEAAHESIRGGSSKLQVTEAKKQTGTPKERTSSCWSGYTQYGMKMKKGRSIPNCVKDK